MATKPKEAEVVYDAKGKRVCGSIGMNGKPCMRPPDRGQLRCYRHAQPRDENGKAPTRGKRWTDARGRDTSYIDTLGLDFDPEAADLQFEIELTTRHINALSVEYDDAIREMRRGGRDCRNPQAIRAELTAVLEVKRKLVTAQTQRVKQRAEYLTLDQVEVLNALFFYLVKRLDLTTEQNEKFVREARICWDAPWKIKELPPRKHDNRSPWTKAEHLVDRVRQGGETPAAEPMPAAVSSDGPLGAEAEGEGNKHADQQCRLRLTATIRTLQDPH